MLEFCAIYLHIILINETNNIFTLVDEIRFVLKEQTKAFSIMSTITNDNLPAIQSFGY